MTHDKAVNCRELIPQLTELARRGRVVASVPIQVVGSDGQTAVSATIDWFITRNPGGTTE